MGSDEVVQQLLWLQDRLAVCVQGGALRGMPAASLEGPPRRAGGQFCLHAFNGSVLHWSQW